MKRAKSPLCTKCNKRNCFPKGSIATTTVDIKNSPAFCPMKINEEDLAKAWNEYEKRDVGKFARQAAIQEAECYELINGELRTRIPRIEETIQFAKKMNYNKIGIVFCLGLATEAGVIDNMLENNGFEVLSICCKTGGIPKEKIGVQPKDKVGPPDDYDTMCNPIAQAEVMNTEKPDWVIMLGLCVGHDTLFFKYCKRPITVLAVKDRVLAHNPLGALYLSGSIYYKRLLSPVKELHRGKS